MAIRTLTVQTKQFVSLVPCQEVILCLSGDDIPVEYLTATVDNTGRFLGNTGLENTPRFHNPRAVELYQYQFSYDDEQTEGEAIDCSVVSEIFPYPCLFGKLVTLIEG